MTTSPLTCDKLHTFLQLLLLLSTLYEDFQFVKKKRDHESHLLQISFDLRKEMSRQDTCLLRTMLVAKSVIRSRQVLLYNKTNRCPFKTAFTHVM